MTTAVENETKVWKSEAGPRQTKQVNEAISAFQWRAKSYITLNGVVERRSEMTPMFGSWCEDATVKHQAIGERFGWTITRDNYDAIVNAYTEARQTLDLPVKDERIGAEEQQQREQAIREREQRDAERTAAIEASHAAIQAKAPHWAQALIMAELDENDSDAMTDYHNHKTCRRVAIGWRRGGREDFKQLRLAAASFPETAHMGPGCEVFYLVNSEKQYITEEGIVAFGGNRAEFPSREEAEAFVAAAGMEGVTIEFESIEHRENWSMGAGNYLKAGSSHSSGWKIRSHQGERAFPHAIIEDHLPDPKAPPAIPDVGDAAQGVAQANGPVVFHIEKHRHTKRGFDMHIVVLDDRVERDMFDRLRASCEAAGGWYSRKWGSTPGGFAFKDESKAKAWAGAQ